MLQWMKKFGSILLRFGFLLLAVWAILAILYSALPVVVKIAIVVAFVVSCLLALVGKYSNYRTRLGFVVLFSIVFRWWFMLQPSNNRNWQPDVAVPAWADVDGDRVTIHNIRNCDYRSETDYTVYRYDKTFDLTKLQNLDLFVVYWGSPNIAHTILSFGFGDTDRVCFSIETRKEIGEEYSTSKGFFRQYELIYVVADERDLIGLRTNYRHEQVYLYRLRATKDFIRNVLLDYLRKVNSLKDRPEWYNALTSNCTTSAIHHTAPYDPDGILDWRILANGYIDEMLYERKRIDTSLPFPELKKRSLINDRAMGLDKSPEFSRLIRVGLPGMETSP